MVFRSAVSASSLCLLTQLSFSEAMRNKARLSITGSVGENGRVLAPDCPKAVHAGHASLRHPGLAVVSSRLPWKNQKHLPCLNDTRRLQQDRQKLDNTISTSKITQQKPYKTSQIQTFLLHRWTPENNHLTVLLPLTRFAGDKGRTAVERTAVRTMGHLERHTSALTFFYCYYFRGEHYCDNIKPTWKPAQILHNMKKEDNHKLNDDDKKDNSF